MRETTVTAPAVPPGVLGKWIQWVSIRHTDCRRPSGVGYNRSKYHFKMNDESLKALCGKEIQIESSERFHRQRPICRICEKRLSKLSLQKEGIER